MQAHFVPFVFKQIYLEQSVRFEDIRTVFNLFQSGYVFFTFDLKSDYHHVEIFSRSSPVSGFFLEFWLGC